jgi:multicomponent Na+:H+ antiporter subunit E
MTPAPPRDMEERKRTEEMTSPTDKNPREGNATAEGGRRRSRVTVSDVIVFLFLLVLWHLLSGAIDVGRAAAGIVLAAGLTAFWKMSIQPATPDSAPLGARGLYRLLLFLGRLHWEVLLANIKMMGFIWRFWIPLKPKLFTIDVRVQSPALRVLLANAITMTPGTLAVELTEDQLLIHCVDESLSVGMAESALVKSLERVEGIES